jgi:RNA polymerase sigma-70 factor (ECF subfamily)
MSAETLLNMTGEPLANDLDRIFRDYYRLVYRTAYGVTGNAEDAEDILQTIFARLIGREVPPALEKNPRAYLYRAAVNLSLNTIRARRRRVSTDRPERFASEPQTHDSDAIEVLNRRLYRAIAKLDAEAGEILILRYVHDMSDAEIAKLMGKSRVVIAVRLNRLRARLKTLILAEEDDHDTA